ncbi:hypothetical protein PPSIR1_22736 [Plesiocystis pacifica SIR-1]|uniref:Uncharacterized protein n=1 Tax=Plesiocystis pacifica SIR-1 TaxID=391625 RepID=A6G2H0_9BACT|nr:hypothetical protein PPSIR1_22736 [Plesiocystis pacifica SIR-1]
MSVLRLIVSVVAALFVPPPAPASGPCPPEAAALGHAPPDGKGWACVLTGEGGQRLRHGWSVDYWPNGARRRACEYRRDVLDGRCSEWDDAGELLARGSFAEGARVGYWWFWGLERAFAHPDGAAARGSTQAVLVELGASEADAPALAQHVLEHVFEARDDIRAAPQLCSLSACVSAATVDERAVLAVQLQPPPDKAEANEAALASAAQLAAAAQKTIARARRKRDEAQAKAEARYESRVRSWENTRLQCADGTRSPSCTCGYDQRGCCSHHGGVAGCPRAYPDAPELDDSPLVTNEFVDDAAAPGP